MEQDSVFSTVTLLIPGWRLDPVHVKVKVVVLVMFVIVSLPEVAFVPDHPREAVQELAPTVDQVKVGLA